MKIVLVSPRWVYKEYAKFDEALSLQQPLGIACLAAVLEEAGHKVKLIDAAAQDYENDDAVKEIKSFGAELVGISPTTASFSRALPLAEKVKTELDLPVIVGGPHASALPEQTLQNPWFDIAVIGEGEMTMLELAERLESGADPSDVEGIAYRKDGRVHRNRRRPYITDLDSLPFPARHLLPPLEVYRPTPSAHKCLPQATMVTSRGCPYKCTFCDHSVFGNAYRARSAGKVVDEIQLLVEKHGAKEIRFWDDTFNMDSQRLLRICNEIMERGIDVPWTCLVRMDHMNEDVLRAMARSGCWQVDYGIESGNQELLDRIEKGLTIELARKVTRMTRRAGIGVRGFFMLGLPGETEKTMRQTIDFAKELDLTAVVFHITTPFPGTELFEMASETGELDLRVNWDNYTLVLPQPGPYAPQGLTRETVLRYQAKAYREFYFRPSFVMRKILDIRKLSDLSRYVTGFRVVRNLRKG